MCRGATTRALGRIAEPSRRRRLLPEAVPEAVPQEAIVLLPRLAEEEARAQEVELPIRAGAPDRGTCPGTPHSPAERAW